uniref:Uncharacterized protein n=1 Tax=Rhizophora mucronata TaxID=61149 RepID=A0A2P2NYU3_RHIMU
MSSSMLPLFLCLCFQPHRLVLKGAC